METEGSNCFHEALKAKKIVTLESINSIAKSLGALSVSEELLNMALNQDFKVQSHIVSYIDINFYRHKKKMYRIYSIIMVWIVFSPRNLNVMLQGQFKIYNRF